MLAYYTELLRLRRTLALPDLAASVRGDRQGPVVLLWYGATAGPVLLANTAPDEQRVSTRDSPLRWAVMLNSDDTRWGGRGRVPAGPDAHGTRTIPGRTALLLAAGGVP